MKKLLGLLIATVALSLGLMSCIPNLPPPEIKDGLFNVSVTYEVNGEIRTLDCVYVCKYEGIKLTVDGVYYRRWRGYFEDEELSGDTFLVHTTDDGGEILLCFLIYPEYFMGEPDYAEDFYPHVVPNLIYYEDDGETISEMYHDSELISGYGVRIIGIEYDDPIENSFGASN